MKIPADGKLLRIFVGESDKFEGKPLYEAIMLLAREKGMAGCTVIKGMAGFGADSRMHTTKIMRLSEDLPMLIEIVDSEERIEMFLPCLDKMIIEGLVTTERVNVVMYRHS